MKTRRWKIVVFWLVCSCAVARGGSTSETVDDAVQAIRQAPDPSAVVAAYANGLAVKRNDLGLYEAYIDRMVDLGLPELAFHQAETLNTLESNNGLAWGVVAYVDARRGQMPEAVAAINLGGQFAADSKFVQHTAGELIAWYDKKADKTKLPEAAKEGLARIRSQLEQQPAFVEAYDTASKAYETQTSATASPATPNVTSSSSSNQYAPTFSNAPPVSAAPQAPADQIAPLGYAAPTAQADFYPDYSGAYYYGPGYDGVYVGWGPVYYYDWGPGWVAPAPWCWWYPVGYWEGCSFYPDRLCFAFGDFDDFRHHDHDGFRGRDGGFGHGDRPGHPGTPARRPDPSFWHNNAQGGHGFFGTPARPTGAIAQWARAGLEPRAPSTGVAATAAIQRSSVASRPAFLAAMGPDAPSALSSPVAGRVPTADRARLAPGAGAVLRPRSSSSPGSMANSWGYDAAPTPPGIHMAPRLTTPSASSASVYHGMPPPARSWAMPVYRSPVYSTPHYAAPGGSSFRSYGGWHSSATFSSAPRPAGRSSFGGGFRGGGSGGGGSRGGHGR